MAQRIRLNECEWTLAGHFRRGFDWSALKGERDGDAFSASVPGGVCADVIRAGLAAGYESGDTRALEWVGNRVWEYRTLFRLPEEPPEGRSEKAFLMCGDAPGLKAVAVNGAYAGEGGLCCITQQVSHSSENELSLYFQADRDFEGICPDIGPHWGAEARLVSFAIIEDIGCEIDCGGRKITVRAVVMADIRGKYTFKYRILGKNGVLLASASPIYDLLACRQSVTTEIALDGVCFDRPFAVVARLSVERGGIRCDSCESDAVFMPDTDGHTVFVTPAGVTHPGAREGYYRSVSRICAAAGFESAGFLGAIPRGVPAIFAGEGLCIKSGEKDCSALSSDGSFEGLYRLALVTINKRKAGGRVSGLAYAPSSPTITAVSSFLAQDSLFMLPERDCFAPGNNVRASVFARFSRQRTSPAVLEVEVMDILGKALLRYQAAVPLNGSGHDFEQIDMQTPPGTGVLIARARLFEGDKTVLERVFPFFYGRNGLESAIAALPPPDLRVSSRCGGLWIENRSACCAVFARVTPVTQPAVALPGCVTLLPWGKAPLDIVGLDGAPEENEYIIDCMGVEPFVRRA